MSVVPKAAEMMLTSEPITGEEAVRIWACESSIPGRRTTAENNGNREENCKEKSDCSKSCIGNACNIRSHLRYYEGVKAEADHLVKYSF